MSAHCRPGRRPEMSALLRRPACPGARSCQGRSSLDRACAPAEHGSYREARTSKISQIEVSTLSGEPRRDVIGCMQVSSKDGALRVRKCLRPTQQTAAKLEV